MGNPTTAIITALPLKTTNIHTLRNAVLPFQATARGHAATKRKYEAIQSPANPQNRSKVRRASQPAAEGQGALPLAFGYGFVEVPKEGSTSKRMHGWLSLEMLGWNLHAVSTTAPGINTWLKFYQV